MNRPRLSAAPEPLRIETGVPDAHRNLLPISAGHARYRQFAFAHRFQDSWSRTEHRDFWIWAIRDWPQKSGNSALVEAVANAYDRLQREGLSPAGAAEALGRTSASIDRMRRRRQSGTEGGLITTDRETAAEAVTDYCLPRVYTLADREVDPQAFPNLDPGELDPLPVDPRIDKLKRAFDAALRLTDPARSR
jgi:hypothetical protein